jgi:hypothetical protein
LACVRVTGVRQVTDTRQMVIMKGVTGAKLLNILGCTQVTSPFLGHFLEFIIRFGWWSSINMDVLTIIIRHIRTYRAGCPELPRSPISRAAAF